MVLLTMEDLVLKIQDYLIVYGGKVLLALIVSFIGLWLINKVGKSIDKILHVRKFDNTLRPFLISLTTVTLKIILGISVMSMVGIQMTSVIAILGAAGLAVGMALSGTLQNFAGGVILLVFKPFKVGDFIDVQGFLGTVTEIQIFNTILKTPDNKVILIPNGGVAGNSITNYSHEEERRVELKVGIGYEDDIDFAKKVVLEVIDGCTLIKKEPLPFIAVADLGDNAVILVIRVWGETIQYWDIYYYLNEHIKKAFDANKISIPYPQRTVNIKSSDRLQ